MAIPFYENEEQFHQQQQSSEEMDQVDGPAINNHNISQSYNINSSPSSSLAGDGENHLTNPITGTQQDLMAWKLLALAMCKALKDHYQENMVNSNSAANTTTGSSSSAETQTAVIQILPNGQVKPQWQ